MAAAPIFGRMKEFRPDSETVTAYLERFQLFVEVNGVEEDKTVPALLTESSGVATGPIDMEALNWTIFIPLG